MSIEIPNSRILSKSLGWNLFVIPVFSVHQPASGGCSSRVLVSPNKHFAMKKLPLYISSLKFWRKHFVFSSVYLTGSGSLSLCNSLLSFCGRAFTGRLPMKPLNVLPVFEKRTPALGFSGGQASFDFFAGNEIFIRTRSCGRLQTRRRWRSGI